MNHHAQPTAQAALCGADRQPACPRHFPALLLLALALSGCAQVRQPATLPAIQDEMRNAMTAPKPAPLPAAVAAALAPESRLELPKVAAQPVEPRFDLAVNNASAQQVFLGIASGTRYSMLLHPEVAGSITVNLKDVSVPEAMSAIRETYGYDYRIDGNRIFVQPLTAQTRFYSINYPSGLRQGKSELRVISGSIADAGGGSSSGGTTSSGSSGGATQVDSSRITTSISTDFWYELQMTVGLLIGCSTGAGATPTTGTAPQPSVTMSCPQGRSVVASPHAGMLAVRALPVEQRQIDEYLKAARISVQRQVMIEAKILEVTLNEGAQSGINWSIFHKGTHSWSKGANTGAFPVPGAAPTAGTSLNSLLATGLPVISGATTTSAGVFGLAFQTGSFAALINFLETQGGVQVLSSPRIAAINNQKAILKVGTDEFFVTEITSTPSTSGSTGSTTSTTVTTQPFFSGIALDVTPQIDDADNIILHVHPSVSQVVTDEKTIELGQNQGTYKLPLAKSTVSETDSIVRLKDGEIAAIGGLMKRESRDASTGVPGLGNIPGLGIFFKNSNASRLKQELVILLKPTLIKQQSDWLDTAREAGTRVQEFSTGPGPR
ncbi:MAG: pilus (MSHA type) biogenesis protein MshL [Pseudomonadota bacterium]|nr:pilus (MSHA type) biogenesis protein MshL [Pseudomonadota bacterium]